MKENWKRLRQKTAVALMTSMLFTSVVPVTGLAQTFDSGIIYSDDVGEGISGYTATASVAVEVDESRSDDAIDLASGSDTGSANIYVKLDVKVDAVATASNADAEEIASDTNWNDVKTRIAEAISAKTTMTATISNADSAIKKYISLNTENLNNSYLVAMKADLTGALQTVAQGVYHATVQVMPEVDTASLPDGIIVGNSQAVSYGITVTVGNGTQTVSGIKFKDFHGEGDTVEKAWIYVDEEPVDLKAYCITDDEDVSGISFTSSNTNVAVMDGTILRPLANGITTITAEIKDGDNVTASGQLTVEVWTVETKPDMPEAFDVYEGETWTHIFAGSIASRDSGFTSILKADGSEADSDNEARVSVNYNKAENITTVEVKGKAPGKYTLRCAWHSENRITYLGYIDFTVKEKSALKDPHFTLNGFNKDDKPSEGIMSTWTYIQQGNVDLWEYCNVPNDAEVGISFVSSNPEAASTDEYGILHPHTAGKTTITATMTAPGYETATAKLIVQIWSAKEQDYLPENITMQAGGTWSYTYTEAQSTQTKVFVETYKRGEGYVKVDEDSVKAAFSADFKTLTITAKQVGGYRVLCRRHKEADYTTKYEYMYVDVTEAGVSLKLSADQLVLEPGKSASFNVAYSPETANVKVEFYGSYIKAVYADGKVMVTAANLDEDDEDEEAFVWVGLYQGENLIAEKEISVYVVKKQLEATTVEEVLNEAASKLEEVLKDIGYDEEIPPAVYKIVNEVVETLAAAPKAELSENKEAIEQLEGKLAWIADVASEVHDDTEIEVSGALLNLISMGERKGKMVVKPVEDTTNTTGVTLEIKLQKGSDGENVTKLAVPMQIKLKVSGIDLTKNIRIKHTKESGATEWIYPTVEGEYVVFWVDSYSKFAISNYTTGSGGGGGGGSTGSTSAAGTVTTDAKKGHVNSLTGIITGSGAGYSKWNQDENGWKLLYADGTFAAGAMVTDETGNIHEQIAWEMINGAWYSFGANGYVKSGLVYDTALGGTFYVDINSGMKTGWQMIDGAWRYFNTVSDGKRGIMLTNTTVDGYSINSEGIRQ